jgi:hypothetical protein
MQPKASRARRKKTRSMSGRCVTSATQGTPPTSAAIPVASAASLSTHRTRAPACASACALAAPMPCPAPSRTMPRPSSRSCDTKSVAIGVPSDSHGRCSGVVQAGGRPSHVIDQPRGW